MSNSRSAAWYAMAVLFAINTLNFFDRTIIAAVGEPVRLEFGLDDKSLGVLSTAFTLLYAVVGIPFGRFADKFSRTKLLGIGVFLWSLFTALSGLVGSYRQLFLLRLGVGIGEATCSPTATSMIADMFPSEKRARAVSIFMLGLPIGIALSFALSGTIAKEYGWRMAFIAAGVPGIFAAIAALFIREPIRGNADVRSANEARPSGSIYRRILADPTMRWLIVSGIIHNFCMYALSAFLTPLLMRYHGLDIKDANLYAMVINGLMTLPGLLLAGVVGDHAKSRRKNGALLVLTAAVFFSAPFFLIALQVAPGNTLAFVAPMGIAFALLYFYYAIVYSTIQDITDSSERGTAMSVYFFSMYVFGGALGPLIIGAISDYFTKSAAATSGIVEFSNAALEPFRASGLHNAMYVVPALCVVLALVMFASARTVGRSSVAKTSN